MSHQFEGHHSRLYSDEEEKLLDASRPQSNDAIRSHNNGLQLLAGSLRFNWRLSTSSRGRPRPLAGSNPVS